MDRTKVSDIPYERVKIEDVTAGIDRAIEKIGKATSADDVLAARDLFNDILCEFTTANALANARFTLNTKDEYYYGEKQYYDEVTPICEVKMLDYIDAFLNSRYIAEVEKRINPVIIRSFEVRKKAVSDKIVAEMQQDNALVTEYSKFVSELTYEFRGKKITLNELRKYAQDSDRATRKEAYCALGATLDENHEFIDGVFDRMVKNRDTMAKKMGYKNFVELGYYRMGRLDYDADTVKVFRENVLKDIVPVVTRLKKSVAEKLGIGHMRLYDNDTYFDEDPKPVLDSVGILKAGQEMYREMSEETGDFMDMMMETDAFDVFTREGKWTGGYMTSFDKYHQPFIFANFNGTTADVDVITHEAGHAFAYYMSEATTPYELGLGGMETAETHSMSMEFFAWKYIDKFFGKNADKYRYKHLFDSLTFIPYGTIVDYFQQIVYERPEMTPEERDTEWKKLEDTFRPWMDADDVPYLSKGTRWQYQNHIFESPFYYIDYCLAQTIAIEFLAESQKDYDKAFKAYLQHASRGGSYVFTDLVKLAGLKSPFEKGALKEVAATAERLLNELSEKL